MAKNYEQLTLFDMDEKKIEIEDKGNLEDVTDHIHFARTNTD
jgi:hypothetical protein